MSDQPLTTDELRLARMFARSFERNWIGAPGVRDLATTAVRLAAEVERLQAQLADAWDEGYYAGVDYEADGQRGPEPPNPYRAVPAGQETR